MGFTTILMTVSLVTIASAGFPSRFFYEDGQFAGSPLMTLRFGNLAAPPAMPAINLPIIPNPFFFNPFPTFTMPPFTMPKPLTAEEIANAKPADGGTFTGMVVKTQTDVKRDKDGNLIKQSGTTYLVNNDGNVEVKQTGDSPPPIATNPSSPSDSDAPKINPFKPHKFNPEPDFDSFDDIGDFGDFGSFDFTFPTMKPIDPKKFKNHLPAQGKTYNFDHTFSTFDSVDPEKIKTYVPAEGETYEGHSINSQTYYSNNNGVISQGGSMTKVKNDNGVVKESKEVYTGTTK